MVNVQSNDQFGSHQLNRDCWSDATVAGIIMGSFIFWQVGLPDAAQHHIVLTDPNVASEVKCNIRIHLWDHQGLLHLLAGGSDDLDVASRHTGGSATDI